MRLLNDGWKKSNVTQKPVYIVDTSNAMKVKSKV